MRFKPQVMMVVCTAMILASVTAASAARSDHNRLREILVEMAFHHLGDGVGFPSYMVPDAEGTFWQTTVWIKQGHLRGVRTAHLEYFLFDSSINSILINGKPYALPETDATKGNVVSFISKTIMPIPMGLLHRGANTIAFQSNSWLTTGNFDDFEFGEVVLVLSK